MESATPFGNVGRPEGIDLDVVYIERTPKYERYDVLYENGAPKLSDGSETARRWPENGEIVTFAARVMNKGTQPVANFGAAWYIDGELIKTDVGTAMLWPNTTAIFELQWAWGHRLDGERLLDTHTVRFVVDPEQKIAESFENNNEVEDFTGALALEIAISPQAYLAFNNEAQAGRSFSAEDWLQRHAKALNQILADSLFPATPDGVGVRVRIDKIRIVWEQPLVDLGYDGGWFVNDDYRISSIYYHAEDDLDWGMLHEWGHQVGLIDTYRYLAAAESVDVLRQDGSRLDVGYDFPGDGLMETVGNKQLDELNAAGLNRTQGYRRGYYGEFQFDLADAIVLTLVDAQGCSVPDAAVAFYQRDAASGEAVHGEADAKRRIDNQAEFTGFTDAAGHLTLPNRPSGSPQTTATGFRLHDNPFGQIEVIGSGNLGLLKVQKDGHEQFTWLSVADLNLDYWLHGKPPIQYVNWTWTGANDAANCAAVVTPVPTATPNPTETATPTETVNPTATATPIATAIATPIATPTTEPVITPSLPTAPANVKTEVIERTQIILRWNDRSNNENEFIIRRSEDAGATWQQVAAVAADSRSWTDQTATCDMRYHYRLEAVNSQGVATAVEKPAAITALCESSAPNQLGVEVSGQAGGGESVRLTWHDASAWEDGFRVEWTIGNGSWSVLANLGAGATTHQVSGLACGLAHHFRVVAYNGAGASAGDTELVYTTAPCTITFKKLYLPLLSSR